MLENITLKLTDQSKELSYTRACLSEQGNDSEYQTQWHPDQRRSCDTSQAAPQSS